MTDTHHLPSYGGREPSKLRLAFSGKDEHHRDALPLDAPVTLIVHGKVNASAFKTNQFGHLVLVQSISVDHAVIADEESVARVQAEIKRRQDEEVGQTSLDDELDDEVDGDDDPEVDDA